MLFKLSLKNMKKSFKDYAIYFITLVLGVAVFYMFNSLDSQQAMLMYGKEASNRKQEIDRQHYTIPNQRPKDKHCGKI